MNNLSKAEKLHILFAVSYMKIGGSERVASLLCNEWVAQGNKVTLVITYQGFDPPEYPLDSRIKIIYLSSSIYLSKIKLLNQLNRLLSLRNIVKELKPNIIISFITNVNIAIILSTLWLKIPIIISERTNPKEDIYTSLEYRVIRRLLYRFAKVLVVQTESLRTIFEKYMPKRKIHIIPNPIVFPLPIYEPKIHPENIVENNKKLLLSVGRLEYEKGFDILIEAIGNIYSQFENWRFVILGEGSLRDKLMALIIRYRLESKVLLPGKVGNIETWYKRADLFVMSSRYEGFPNALLEAMVYSIPVVTFDIPGTREIIENFGSGWLVDPKSGALGLVKTLLPVMNQIENGQITKKMPVIPKCYDISTVSSQWLGLLEFK